MDGSGTADRVDRAALSRQWRQEGRYEEIAEFRQQVKEATKKAWRSAGRQWDRDELNEVAWQEAARAFPPLDTEGMPATDSPAEFAPRGRVAGLGEIPADVSETLVGSAELAGGPVRRIAGTPDCHDGDLDVGDGRSSLAASGGPVGVGGGGGRL